MPACYNCFIHTCPKYINIYKCRYESLHMKIQKRTQLDTFTGCW
uniref:Uncharacterized protein n=1 Tax=Anguilla anguilla TaxID=7936 RepID=A0A0E9SSX5_ANGAN